MPTIPQYDNQVSPRVGVPDNPLIKPSPVYGAVQQVLGAVQQEIKQRQATEVVDGRLKAAQGLQDLQDETARQPWSEQKKFFEGRAKGLFADINARMSADSQRAFQQDWQALYLPRRTEVTQSAYLGEKDFNRANLDATLDTFAHQIATSPNDQRADILTGQAVSTVADFKNGGWITDQEAHASIADLQRRTDKNRIMMMIVGTPNARGNPTAALQALADPNRFQGLKEEDRIALQQHADTQIQHQIAVSDHAQIVAERNRKLAGDQLAKEGEDLIAQGKMTEEWMQQNRPVLDPSDYRILRHSMQEGGGTDSAQVLADTYQRLYVQGEDVGPSVVDALRNRQITGPTAKSLLNENQQTQGVQSPRQQGLKYITSALKVSDANPDPAAAQRLADAVAEFNRQVAADPKADPMTVARDLTKRYALIDFQDMTLTAPLPRYAVGSRSALDIAQTQAATVQAFTQKHNGDKAAALADPEFQREALLLKRWKEAMDKQSALQAKPSGVK